MKEQVSVSKLSQVETLLLRALKKILMNGVRRNMTTDRALTLVRLSSDMSVNVTFGSVLDGCIIRYSVEECNGYFSEATWKSTEYSNGSKELDSKPKPFN